jgi:peptidyl-prolyl cis-trans isomerase D
MADGLQKKSSNLVVKALLVLLIISFGAWGIADMLQPAVSGGSVAVVEDKEISTQEVYSDFQREMARMRQLTGGQELDPNLSLAIGGSVVDRAVNRTLLEVNANDLDVAISEAQVANVIRDMEMFQENGTFSRERFDQVMFSNQMNEGQYIDLVRSDLARDQVLGALVGGTTVPTSVAQDVFTYRQETRTIDLLTISYDLITDIDTPSGDELNSYYEANIKDFMAPEYRKISLVHLTPDHVASTIDVTIEDLEDAFSARQAEFLKPETRTVSQIVVDSEEAAGKLIAELATGKPLEDVSGDVVSLGAVTKNDLPEELRDAAFNIEKGAYSAPVQSALGWHILTVSEIEAEVSPSFDDVKDDLQKTIALERSADELYSISTQVEDVLGGGGTLEEAAKAIGFDVLTIEATDRQGGDKEGKLIKEIFNNQTILDDVFALEVNAEPAMKDDGLGGYYMVRVDDVTASVARPFETVKDQVLDQVILSKKQEKAKSIAADVATAIKAGQNLETIDQVEGFEVSELAGFSRFDSKLPEEMTKEVFLQEIGMPVTGSNEAAEFIAVLKSVEVPEGEAGEAELKALKDQLANSISTDLQGQYVTALRSKYSIKIDNAMANRLFVQEQ